MKISSVENLNSMQIIQQIYSTQTQTDTCQCIDSWIPWSFVKMIFLYIKKPTSTFLTSALPETIMNASQLIYMDSEQKEINLS